MEKISLHPLHHLGFIQVQGADADAFLQGQFSNDIALLTPKRAQLSSYNSPKGRMLAVLQLVRTQNGITLELERSMLDATLKRLRMFVLRSKVTLTDAGTEVATLGLSGNEAVATLTAAGLPAPAQVFDCAQHGELNVMRRCGTLPRFSIQGPASAISALQKQLAAQIPVADADSWRRLDIIAGVPTVLPQTSDHFVPQMANLDLLGGISFNKGCYTGQEIVARLHYLGQLKRRMFHCRTMATEIEPGTSIYDSSSEQAVGEVAQTASAHGGSLLSVVLQLAHATSENLHLGTPSGPALSRPVAHTGVTT